MGKSSGLSGRRTWNCSNYLDSRNVGYGTRSWLLIKIIATSDHFKDEDGDLPIGARSIQEPDSCSRHSRANEPRVAERKAPSAGRPGGPPNTRQHRVRTSEPTQKLAVICLNPYYGLDVCCMIGTTATLLWEVMRHILAWYYTTSRKSNWYEVRSRPPSA